MTTDPKVVELDPVPQELFSPLQTIETLKTPPYPFYVIKPSGVLHLNFIRQAITERNLSIIEELKVPDYNTLARHLYSITPDYLVQYDFLMLNKKLFGDHGNIAHAFILDDSHLKNYQLIVKMKFAIRDLIGIVPYKVIFYGELTDTALNHIHTPDLEDLSFEYSVLRYFT